MSDHRPRRRTLAVAGLVAGLAVAGAGAVAAGLVGPDDWLDYRSCVANPNGERIVRTGYGTLNFGLPSRIRAGTDGEVFIGVGHVMDTEDYLAGLTLSQIDHVDPLRCEVAPVPGSAATPPVAAAGLGFWHAGSQAAGSQQLSGDFTGQPVQAVVVALGEAAGPIVVTFAVRLAGARLTAWLLVAGGAVVSGLAWWRLRRPRRTHGETGDDTAVPVQRRRADVTRALAVGSTLGALVLAGCGTLPVPPPRLPDRDALTRPAPSLGEARAIFSALSRRLNTARAAQGWPVTSMTPQAAAFAEPVLGVVRADVEWNRLTRGKWKPDPLSMVVRAVLGEPAQAYPLRMAAVVDVHWGAKTGAKGGYLQVLLKEHSYTEWRLAGSLIGEDDELPVPGTTALTPGQVSQAGQLARAAVDQAIDGDHSGSVRMPRSFWTFRAKNLKAESFETVRWTRPRAEPALVYAAPATDGTVVYVAFLVQTVYRGKPELVWDPPYDSYHNCHGAHTELSDDTLVEFAIRVRGTRAEVELWDASDYLDERPGC